MLSRVQRLQDLLVLQPFPQKVLHMHIPPALKKEIDRLDELAKKTEALMEWPNLSGCKIK